MAEKADKKNFFEDVYEVVRLIPKGRVTSYGSIASYLGSKGSARMVGWALIASHPHSKIPTHRVVNRVGMLTGKQHFDEPNAMQERLEQEGIKVENNQVVDFEKLFWDPAKELL
ncbi:methylated-DNA-protein-cysteine methyltransferase-like protein [Pontibacter ummariensis]|uniref:Methylated-DNA-protein-cysteine methyltransferase related protein n=1 Tax=Pontibacter ummariensis TaxID=1610492 RepID=A0A239BF85_9BACT|nr:MGMT family protein [Pontibacter ummariensis]PRY16484.1 methylated-DNA-protein-cysteine methyltransferase-like protein [Pontibacter ummariensis]SNS05988.1 methylated-DNA-protein-cysteine methyltransferase related protein [Pontibacter ummariensis]